MKNTDCKSDLVSSSSKQGLASAFAVHPWNAVFHAKLDPKDACTPASVAIIAVGRSGVKQANFRIFAQRALSKRQMRENASDCSQARCSTRV